MSPGHSAAELLDAARTELHAEERRKFIDAAKATLRAQTGRTRMQRLIDLFPYTITRKSK